MNKIEQLILILMLILILCGCGVSPPVVEEAQLPVEVTEEIETPIVENLEAETPTAKEPETELPVITEPEIDRAGIVSRELDVIEHGRDEESLLQLFGSSDLLSGDWLSVHDGGAGRLDFGDGMLLRVFNNSTLKEIRAELVNGIPLDVQMFLVEGGLTGRLGDTDGQAVFTTPGDAKITILGTEFFIVHDPESDLTIAGNFKGTVEVQNAGDTERLQPGHFVELSPGIPPGEQIPFDTSLADFEQRAIDLLSPISAYEELACQDDVELVEGLNILSELVVPPGAAFMVNWHVFNGGRCTWNEGYILQLVEGEPMTGETAVSLGHVVDPGERAPLSISLVAPDEPGTYHSTWQLFGPWGKVISPPLEVAITVSQPPDHTPVPTFVPEAAPDPCLQPSIVTALSDANVRGGPGTNYDAIGILNEGEKVQVIGRNSGAPHWWRIASPRLSGENLWVAEWVVSFSGNSTCVPISVIPLPPTPEPNPEPVAIFPPEIISADTQCGTCKELLWETRYVDAVYLNEEEVPLTGSYNACVEQGQYGQALAREPLASTYSFLALAPDWRKEHSTTINWTSTTVLFGNYPSKTNDCTNLTWYVEEAEKVLLDSEPVEPRGSTTVCPEETQTYILDVELACGWVQKKQTIESAEPDPLPDLVVSAISVYPDQFDGGAEGGGRIDNIVSNLGTAGTQDGNINVSCSANGRSCGNRVIAGPIGPNELSSGAFSVGQDWSPGSYEAVVVVDSENVVAESNEGNNRSSTVSFEIVETLPELGAKIVSPTDGQQITAGSEYFATVSFIGRVSGVLDKHLYYDWYSNVEGYLGSGISITARLRGGEMENPRQNHIITLTVTDASGNVSMDEIGVTVLTYIPEVIVTAPIVIPEVPVFPTQVLVFPTEIQVTPNAVPIVPIDPVIPLPDIVIPLTPIPPLVFPIVPDPGVNESEIQQ